MTQGAPARILEGIRIVETATAVFGPYATMLLGDLGSEVIRAENKAGDNSRSFAGARNPGMSPIFMSFNRNKRSIALDLGDADDMAVMKRPVARSDVFIHSVREHPADVRPDPPPLNQDETYLRALALGDEQSGS